MSWTYALSPQCGGGLEKVSPHPRGLPPEPRQNPLRSSAELEQLGHQRVPLGTFIVFKSAILSYDGQKRRVPVHLLHQVGIRSLSYCRWSLWLPEKLNREHPDRNRRGCLQ